MKKRFWLKEYLYNYRIYAVLNIVFNLLSSVFALFSLAMLKPFFDVLFSTDHILIKKPEFGFGSDELMHYLTYLMSRAMVNEAGEITDAGKVKALVMVCGVITVAIFLKNLFRYLAKYFLAPLRHGVVRDLRNDLFKKILILPLSFYSKEKKGDIISRMTSDVQEIETWIMNSLETLISDPINMLIFLGMMIYISPQLTIFVFVFLPISGFIIGKIGKSLKKTSLKTQGKLGHLLSQIEEAISGLRIIKAFNAIDSSHEHFKEHNEVYYKLNNRIYRRKELASPLSEVLGVMVLVVVILFGGYVVLGQELELFGIVVLSGSSQISASVFITYIAMFSQIINPAKSFTTAYYNIKKGAASADRIAELLNANEEIIEKANALSIKGFESAIEYKDVSFSYETEPVLKSVNLKIAKGKTIALVGQSGAGKTTLADLLPRFYDVTDGQILFDGVDIRDCRIDELRAQLGVVTQNPILFNGTVFSNIAFGMENASKEAVVNAAKVANAHEFIEALPNGYETNIGDAGSKLSGGQRQRLSIARAVLKNPPILILDEATSALDTESERLVQEALFNLMRNRTSIVIAHRLSTIQFADEIIVMQGGEIIERGNHLGLLAKNGVYKKLSELQSFV